MLPALTHLQYDTNNFVSTQQIMASNVLMGNANKLLPPLGNDCINVIDINKIFSIETGIALNKFELKLKTNDND